MAPRGGQELGLDLPVPRQPAELRFNNVRPRGVATEEDRPSPQAATDAPARGLEQRQHVGHLVRAPRSGWWSRRSRTQAAHGRPRAHRHRDRALRGRGGRTARLQSPPRPGGKERRPAEVRGNYSASDLSAQLVVPRPARPVSAAEHGRRVIGLQRASPLRGHAGGGHHLWRWTTAPASYHARVLRRPRKADTGVALQAAQRAAMKEFPTRSPGPPSHHRSRPLTLALRGTGRARGAARDVVGLLVSVA